MARFGKKTLYLNLDAIEEIQAALSKFPGRPSVSSFINDHLPLMASTLTDMVKGFERAGMHGVADIADELFDSSLELLVSAKAEIKKGRKQIKDVPPQQPVSDVPASKPKRQKKMA